MKPTVLPEDAAREVGLEMLPNLQRFISVELRNRLATIQHKVDRLHPDRLKPKPNEVRYTMWCWECNDQDAKRRNRECVDEQRRRSAGR
jgi:hypothetical protein